MPAIRAYRQSDYDTWKDAYVNRLPKQYKYDRAPISKYKCSMAKFKKLIKRHERLSATDQTYIYGVFERKTGTLVGAIDIHILIRQNYQLGNLGYQIHNRYWRKGFGKEAATAGLRIAFSQLKLQRLEAAIDFDNKPSLGLAKSIGMRREGIKREYLFENGKWVDQISYVSIPRDIGLKSSHPSHI